MYKSINFFSYYLVTTSSCSHIFIVVVIPIPIKQNIENKNIEIEYDLPILWILSFWYKNAYLFQRMKSRYCVVFNPIAYINPTVIVYV